MNYNSYDHQQMEGNVVPGPAHSHVVACHTRQHRRCVDCHRCTSACDIHERGCRDTHWLDAPFGRFSDREHLGSERRDSQVAVVVTDHGIGNPAAALPRLFQRCFRATNVEEQHISGLGIGLYVIKEIVSLHGGSIEVNSTEGQGSTFTVCFSLVEA